MFVWGLDVEHLVQLPFGELELALVGVFLIHRQPLIPADIECLVAGVGTVDPLVGQGGCMQSSSQPPPRLRVKEGSSP